jgi:carbonic anhydrase
MSTSSEAIAQLLANNEKYTSTFNGAPTMEQIRAVSRSKDGRPLFILTCVDPRCVPEAFFGPDLQAAVHRNGGGRATDDVVRTLNLLRALVHMKTVVVVHHTDCGVTHVTEDEIREYAMSKNPAAAAIVDKIDFDLWKEEHLEDSVRKDVRKLREEKSLEGIEVFGFVLDTQTAVVTEVQV